MKRRIFIQGGSAAAVSAALTACGGGGGGGVAGPGQLEASATAPAPAPPTSAPAAIPEVAPVAPAPGIYSFQQEFDNPSAPLLRGDGGQFYPYFTYYGGDAQPDGPNGWRGWSGEDQVYTTSKYQDNPFNPHSVANSVLTITAKPNPKANPNGNLPWEKPFLSGCLETSKGGWFDDAGVRNARGGFEQKYGYWEARVKMPKGPGVWGAFWLDGGIQKGVGGEKHGEIDIFETIGDKDGNLIHQTVHDWWAATDPNDGVAIKTAFDPAADFHDYGVLWTPTEIIWYIDGKETRRASPEMCKRYRELAGPMYMCFNIAMGGGWAGPAAADTTAQMEIDWVRVKAYTGAL